MLQGREALTSLSNTIDCGQDLEKLLKSSCEEFILMSTRRTIEPLLSFLTKASAFSSLGSSHGGGVSIRDQTFAEPEQIKTLLNAVLCGSSLCCGFVAV